MELKFRTRLEVDYVYSESRVNPLWETEFLERERKEQFDPSLGPREKCSKSKTIPIPRENMFMPLIQISFKTSFLLFLSKDARLKRRVVSMFDSSGRTSQ